jgi:hypothetical protein
VSEQFLDAHRHVFGAGDLGYEFRIEAALASLNRDPIDAVHEHVEVTSVLIHGGPAGRSVPYRLVLAALEPLLRNAG